MFIIRLSYFFSSKRRHKKKIRRILDDAELGEETKKKIAIEKVAICIKIKLFLCLNLICCLKLFIILPTFIGTSGTTEVFARTVFCLIN